MKLKTLESKTAVYCTTKEQLGYFVEDEHEVNLLAEYLPLWLGVNHDGGWDTWGPNKDSNMPGETFYKKRGYTCVEFMDIIIPEDSETPEVSAEEVVPLLIDICHYYNDNDNCKGCPLLELEKRCNGEECPFTIKDWDKAVETCAQWKWRMEYEKKKMESEFATEWIWQGKILDENKMRQHPYLIFDIKCENREEAEQYAANKLKEYCKNHNGEYIAVVDRVCKRVKGEN